MRFSALVFDVSMSNVAARAITMSRRALYRLAECGMKRCQKSTVGLTVPEPLPIEMAIGQVTAMHFAGTYVRALVEFTMKATFVRSYRHFDQKIAGKYLSIMV